MHDGHAVLLAGPVYASVCLQVSFYTRDRCVPDDSICCGKSKSVRSRLRLNDKHLRVVFRLEVVEYFTAVVERDFARDDF